jgi:hypothetical protein
LDALSSPLSRPKELLCNNEDGTDVHNKSQTEVAGNHFLANSSNSSILYGGSKLSNLSSSPTDQSGPNIHATIHSTSSSGSKSPISPGSSRSPISMLIHESEA